MKKRLIFGVIFAIIALIASVLPAYAISNPTSITWGTGVSNTYDVFYNVIETGDWLITAEGYVHYASTPTDYTAAQAFLFELLDTAGTTTLVSIPLVAYEDRPISIYLSPTRVTTLGLTTGTAYKIRITGNPIIFPTQTGNTITATLAPTDFINQTLGADSSPPTDNLLRNNLITMMMHIDTHDAPATSYLTSVGGYQYITTDGANIMIAGIPGLTSMCPILFQSGSEPMSANPPEHTGAYAQTLTPQQKWGTVVANGLTNIGVYLGVNQALAGALVLFILAIMLAVGIYQATQSSIAVLLLVAAVLGR